MERLGNGNSLRQSDAIAAQVQALVGHLRANCASTSKLRPLRGSSLMTAPLPSTHQCPLAAAC
jgi:hypothetical protein